MDANGYLCFSIFFHPPDKEVRSLILAFVINSCDKYLARWKYV